VAGAGPRGRDGGRAGHHGRRWTPDPLGAASGQGNGAPVDRARRPVALVPGALELANGEVRPGPALTAGGKACQRENLRRSQGRLKAPVSTPNGRELALTIGREVLTAVSPIVAFVRSEEHTSELQSR